VEPSGFRIVNVTLAPAAGELPLSTWTENWTFVRTLTEDTDWLKVTESGPGGGGGGSTVRLAVAATGAGCVSAIASTSYVPGDAVEGTVFVMVTFIDCPGASVTVWAEKDVGQPCGFVEPRLKLREPHEPESLLFNVTVYPALLPGSVLGLGGDTVSVGAASTQGAEP
jgi:hypothetical protein